MAVPPLPLFTITLDEVIADLESGRRHPLVSTPPAWSLPSHARPTAGSLRSRLLWLAARTLGGLHPRLARGALSALWFTPWVHPSARATTALPARFVPWSQSTTAGDLHGYAGGHGPTIVLLHGWAGRAADWRHLADDLAADGWRVVVPDLPGHGASPGRRTDLYAMGRAFAAVLDEERPVAVVAHSMGFPVTMLAIEHGAPEPEHLVAIAPGRKVERVVAAFARRMAFPPASPTNSGASSSPASAPTCGPTSTSTASSPACGREDWSSTIATTTRSHSPTDVRSPPGGRRPDSRSPSASATAGCCATKASGPWSRPTSPTPRSRPTTRWC